MVLTVTSNRPKRSALYGADLTSLPSSNSKEEMDEEEQDVDVGAVETESVNNRDHKSSLLMGNRHSSHPSNRQVPR